MAEEELGPTYAPYIQKIDYFVDFLRCYQLDRLFAFAISIQFALDT